MKVALYGSTGKAGSRILKELVSRGHRVTAIARDPAKLEGIAGITSKKDDLSDVNRTTEAIRGVDAVISAYGPPQDKTDEIVEVTQRQVEAVKGAGNPRLLVVGGAGGLNVAPGVTLLESGYLPDAYKPIAESHVRALKVLEASDIDWTYLAPAAYFEPGERTGKFRVGKDELIANEKQESRISMEDYAIALVNELEKPAHRKQRFSVGY
ncbi:MAG: NAD(P)-dependent oxidoreductase [Steroidobacteraceae bacterium]